MGACTDTHTYVYTVWVHVHIEIHTHTYIMWQYRGNIMCTEGSGEQQTAALGLQVVLPN